MSQPAIQHEPAEEKSNRHALWHNRDYMLLWGGQVVSTAGTGISRISLPLLILAITHSPAQAGLVGLFYFLPYLLLSLPAGGVVDRTDRKRLMILCDTIRALNAASIPAVAFARHLTLIQILLNAVIEGTCYTFFNVAQAAALPRVVPKEQIPAATAQNQGSSIATALVSPSIGTIFFQITHTFPFLFDAISYVTSVITLRTIRTPFQKQQQPTQQSLSELIVEGIKWLWHQPLIRYMALLTSSLNFVEAATPLTLIVIAKNEHTPTAAIGVIFSIGSIGGILGALLAPRIKRRFGFGRVILAVIWISALLWPFYALAPNFLVLGAITAALYCTTPIYNVVQFSYRISIIPDNLQGRVNSVYRLLAFGFMPLGTVVAGLFLQAFNTTGTVIFFSAVTLLIAVATTFNTEIRTAAPTVPTTSS